MASHRCRHARRRHCRRVANIKGSPTLYARTMHPSSSLMTMFTAPTCHIIYRIMLRTSCAAGGPVRVAVLDYQFVDNTTRCDVCIGEQFVAARQISPSSSSWLADREFIWVDNICRCPALDVGDSYVLTGRLVPSRLQITDRSPVLQTDSWERRFAGRNFNCRRLSPPWR